MKEWNSQNPFCYPKDLFQKVVDWRNERASDRDRI